MKGGRWRWIGASSTGTSHLGTGADCDDAGACIETQSSNGATLIAVVSDGAGSASLSRIGSHIVVRAFSRSALKFARQGKRPKDLDGEIASEWIDDIRDRIELASLRENVPRRNFAATLIGCVIQIDGVAVIHIGDGACVVRLRNEIDWRVASWPSQGEYASTTYFVTDDPEPRTSVNYLSGEVAEVALFSDGLERLALDFTTRTAYPRFFDTMFQAFPVNGSGRDKDLSRSLQAFLDSPKVTDRTDDDKMLIMARRY
jgi:hypothetical protein